MTGVKVTPDIYRTESPLSRSPPTEQTDCCSTSLSLALLYGTVSILPCAPLYSGKQTGGTAVCSVDELWGRDDSAPVDEGSQSYSLALLYGAVSKLVGRQTGSIHLPG